MINLEQKQCFAWQSDVKIDGYGAMFQQSSAPLPHNYLGIAMGSKRVVQFGERFNGLVYVGESARRNGERHCLYRCDCGKLTEANYHNVRRGKSKSCGCLCRTESTRASVKIGARCNHLEVVRESESIGRRRRVLCRCDCGNYRDFDYTSLNASIPFSCGCVKRVTKLRTGVDVGTKYNNLTVLGGEEWRNGSKFAAFRCDCGLIKKISYHSVVSGGTKSCGCLIAKHRKSDTPVHKAWSSMRQRCNNPKHKNFLDYGGRGISVDPRWDEFLQFEKDMGPRPRGGSIDRKDTNGNYCPENCWWATRSDQQNNRRISIIWTVDGVEYDTSRSAMEKHGIGRTTLGRWCKGHVGDGRYYPPKEGCGFRKKYPDLLVENSGVIE